MNDCECKTCRPIVSAKVNPSWKVDVKNLYNEISLQKGTWLPQIMSITQAKEIIKGLQKAVDFLEQEPQKFTPHLID